MENALITWMSEKKGEKKKEGSVGVYVLWLSGCCCCCCCLFGRFVVVAFEEC